MLACQCNKLESMPERNSFYQLTINIQALLGIEEHAQISEVMSNLIENEICILTQNFWKGLPRRFRYFEFLYLSHFQHNLLRQAYLYYFALANIPEIDRLHSRIEATNIVFDAVLRHFKIAKTDACVDLSEIFLMSGDIFKESSLLKRFLKSAIRFLISVRLYKPSTLFVNSGKLDKSIRSLTGAISMFAIIPDLAPEKNSKIYHETDSIKSLIRKNISESVKLIPAQIIEDIVERTLLVHLDFYIALLEYLQKFIVSNKIRLVISSCPINDIQLILLMAGRLCGIPSLLLPHGAGPSVNANLKNIVTHQAVLFKGEHVYKGAKSHMFKMNWFNSLGQNV